MIELLAESFMVPNLPVTIILLIVLLYWIVNLVGIFDIDMLHADVDGGGDLHADGDSGSWFSHIFDFGDLPLAIVISFFTLFLWMGTIICNHYLGNSSLFFALLIYIPNIILGYILTRFIAAPLGKAYHYLNIHTEEASSGDFTGAVCVVVIEANATSMGQAEINRNGDVFRVNIKTYPKKALKKGQSALLIEHLSEKGYYIADPYENLK